MKQLLLHKRGVTVQDVPAPAHDPFNILVEVSHSLISTGTEMATVQQSKDSILDKIKKRPQQVVKVLDSIRVRGVKRTLAIVQNMLDEYRPLGYSCTGVVLAVGEKVSKFKAGDRVACAGAALANHAEIVSVPENLAVKVPGTVTGKSAAFVTLGAIALQGVRRAEVRLGEVIAVIGLGLIGQITVQLLKASGCKVVGLDLDPARVRFAEKHGLDAGTSSPEELAKIVFNLTGGQGVDASILTASTSSSEPTRQAFELTRRKGKIVVVGAVGMELVRSPFYEKEQDFLISCSYGPGRYDPEYEKLGKDYPYGYVRWTENRNMAAFLDLIQNQKIEVEPLIGAEFKIEEAEKAYALLGEKSGQKPLAVILNYPAPDHPLTRDVGVSRIGASIYDGRSDLKTAQIRLGLIGFGNFVKATHLPNIRNLKEKLKIIGVCASNGNSVATAGRQLQAAIMTTDYKALIQDPRVDAVLIATRHDKHAKMAEDALKAGKHVYLEKPLALEIAELDSLDAMLKGLSTPPTLVVGFNRRYAPLMKKLYPHLAKRGGPIVAHYRVNAGELPANHWTKTFEGGGRLRGEACHMIDLFQAIVGYPLKGIMVSAAGKKEQDTTRPDENFSAQLTYQDGSLCNLVYTSLGNPNLPKEYIEIHWDGKSAVLEDFSRLTIFGENKKTDGMPQDKGHLAALEVFANAIANGVPFPTPWANLYETTQAAIELDKEVWGRIPT